VKQEVSKRRDRDAQAAAKLAQMADERNAARKAAEAAKADAEKARRAEEERAAKAAVAKASACQELLVAAAQGDVATVQKALKSGADVAFANEVRWGGSGGRGPTRRLRRYF
jgi:Tfp pilus assembly protein PilX